MIIHSLELQNFGRIGSLSSALAESTVGIEGKSGCGKSTMLHAIRFALTGEVDDGNVSSFRRDGGKHGKTVVDMRFSQKGVDYRIVRTIGKTSTSRELYLPGAEAPITAAKEVDRRMLELFGSDHKAIEGCVFVPQGKIDEVLFGSQAEREARFMRMLGLTHLTAVTRALDTQLGVLRSQQVDYGTSLQTVRNQLEEHRVALDELNKRITGTQVTTAEEEQRLRESVQRAEAVFQINGQLQQSMLWLVAHCAAHKTTKEELTATQMQLAEKKTKAASRQAAKNVCMRWLAARDKAAAAQLSFATCLQQRDSVFAALQLVEKVTEEDLSAARTNWAAKNKDVSALERAVELQTQLRDAENQLTSLTTELTAATLDLAAVELAARNSAASLFEIKLRSEPEIQKLGFKLTLLKQVHSHGVSATCPVCDGSITSSSGVADWIRDVEVALTKARGELDAANAAHLEIDKRLREATKRNDALLLRRSAAASDKEQRLAAVRAYTVTGGLSATLATALCDGTDLRPALETTKRDLVVIEESGKTLNAKAGAYASALSKAQHAQGALEKAKLTLDHCEAAVSEAAAELKQITGLEQVSADNALLVETGEEQDIKAMEASIHARQENIAAYDKENARAASLESQRQALIGEDKALQASENLEVMLAERKAKLEACVRSRAEQQTWNNQRDFIHAEMHKAGAREAQIVDAMQQQAHITSTIARLETVRNAFDKTGASRLFIRDKFNLLIMLINRHLATLLAPFECRPSDKPLTFEFRRTDEPSEWMDQGKLSGGQRVRASVAFLLAAQDLLVPDVGLLVLDEPSMHLDTESQENLRDLLAGMAETWRRQERQIIVSDHCQLLMPAFRRRVQLD